MHSGKSDQSATCTTCPYCGVGCGVKVTQSGSEFAIAGDTQHPANFGKLCSKGLALGGTLGYENRLFGPTINNLEVSWSDALDRISSEFKSVIEKYGPEAIAFYVSGQLLTEDYYVVNKLVKGYLGTGNIDTNSRLCMASSVAGHKRAFGSDTVPGCYEDLEKAELLVLVGSNLAWCHPVLFRRIEAARKAAAQANRPFTVVVIDPRVTATAEMADLHLPIAPGGENDLTLFLGLLADIVNHQQVDRDWVTQHTNHFSETIAEALPWTAELVSKRTGLSKDAIAAFYRLFRSTEKVVTVHSQGVNQSHCGSDTVNSIINVHLATARIGKPGCGPFSITGQPNAMGGREVGGLANTLAAHMDIENEQHRDIVQRFWNAPKMVSKPGLKAVDLFDAVETGQIKALWIMATNPADSMPAANAVARAIANCPFVVVSDVCDQGDTVNLATVRLPAQAWSEKDGTVTNSERRISRQRAFRSAPMDTKPDWWAVCEVAKRLGFQYGFNYRNASEIFTEHAALSGYENNGTRDFDISAYSTLTAKQYDELTPFQWPRPRVSTKDNCDGPIRFFADGCFFTPDQKARFVPVTLSESTDEQVQSSLTHTRSGPLQKTATLLLNTGRSRDQWHTMTRTGYVAKLNSHTGEPFVQVAVGNVFVSMHWSNVFSSNARVNSLIQARTDPISGQPALKNQRITISPADVNCYGVMLSRSKPTNLGFLSYWATVPVDEGWKTEFASEKFPEKVMDIIIARSQLSLTSVGAMTSSDSQCGRFNTCWFHNQALVQAVYVAAEPVWAPRQLISSFLTQPFNSLSDRLAALSASGRQDQANQGAIVCSCMGVGCHTIDRAIAGGAGSVEEIGKICAAGTVCGSCQPEIKTLLKKSHAINQIDKAVPSVA